MTTAGLLAPLLLILIWRAVRRARRIQHVLTAHLWIYAIWRKSVPHIFALGNKVKRFGTVKLESSQTKDLSKATCNLELSSRLKSFFVASLLLVLPSTLWALDPANRAVRITDDVATDSDVGVRSGDFIAAPIPFSNETIGSGATLGAGYLFALPGSKTSGIGAGYFGTNEGSSGYGIGGTVNFNQGRWTVGAIYVDADLNYDLPISGSFELPLTQSVDGYAIRMEYGFTDTTKIGFGYAFADSQLSLNSDFIRQLPEFLQPDLHILLKRLTFDVVHDTRDDSFYPSSGLLVTGNFSYGDVTDKILNDRLTISDRNYGKGVLSLASYNPVGRKGVFAWRAVMCGAAKEAPFFDGCGVGFVDGLRGFSAFDALADWSTSAQIEYRGRLSQRFGYVLFAGAGGGGSGLDSLSFDRGGAGYGAGLRYRLSKQNRLDYSIDYAFNDDGDGLLYLYIGQRF